MANVDVPIPPMLVAHNAHYNQVRPVLAGVGGFVNLCQEDVVVDNTVARDFPSLALAPVPGALPITCGESALKVAWALCKDVRGDGNAWGDWGIPIQPRVMAHAAGMTTQAMIRAVKHHRLNIRVLSIAPGSVVGDVGFVEILPEKRERDDDWAIVFIPATFFLPAFQPAVAHWTVMQAPRPEMRPIRFAPLAEPHVVYTAYPLSDLTQATYWRCRPTPENLGRFIRARDQGLACSCCLRFWCPHEYLFRVRQSVYGDRRGLFSSLVRNIVNFRAQPLPIWLGALSANIQNFANARLHPRLANLPWYALGDNWALRALHTLELNFRVILSGTPLSREYHNMPTVVGIADMIFPGAWRMDVRSCTDPFVFGPDRSLVIRADGFRSHHSHAHNNLAVARFAAHTPFGPVRLQMPFPFSYYFRTTQTFFERIWPFRFWPIDVPVDTQAVRIGNLDVHLGRYERRDARLSTFVKGVLLRLAKCKALMVVADYTTPQEVPGLWRNMAHVLGNSRYKPPVHITFIERAKNYAVDFVETLSRNVVQRVPALAVFSWRRYAVAAPRFDWRYHEVYMPPMSDVLRFSFGFLVAAYTIHSVASLVFEHLAISHEFQYAPSIEPRVDAEDLVFAKAPFSAELRSRLALRTSVSLDKVVVRDIARRLMAESKWVHKVSWEEVEVWVNAVAEERGFSSQPPHVIPMLLPVQCYTCLQKRPIRWHECKDCRRSRVHDPEVALRNQLTEYGVFHLGFVGIWSQPFTPPIVELKPNAYVKLPKIGKTTSMAVVMTWYRGQDVTDSMRGRNAGPTFTSFTPTCYPRHKAVAILAFCFRLAGARTHQPDPRVWDAALLFKRWRLRQLERSTKLEILLHYKGAKLRRMQQAYQEIMDGWLFDCYGRGNDGTLFEAKPMLRAGGFPKAEKSSMSILPSDQGFLYLDKPRVKPRLIVNPDPKYILELSCFTHPQLKWLAETRSFKDHLYYAGCSPPEELNLWCNTTLQDLGGSFVTYNWDVNSMDSNHSKCSYSASQSQFKQQFPGNHDRAMELLTAMRTLKLKIDNVGLYVEDVLPSGVPNTSYLNSDHSLSIAPLALAHAVRDCTNYSIADWYAFAWVVLQFVWVAVAGDDGHCRLPRYILGTDMMTAEAQGRFVEIWSLAGFPIDLVVFAELDWRHATFLAHRPVWSGHRYEWAPEHARRLRGLYWMIDCPLHPVAWARGVSRQMATAYPHDPVISVIANWYLHNTKGPTIQYVSDNPFYAYRDYKGGGHVTPRAIREMCEDYKVSTQDYDYFLSQLRSTRNVLVAFRCHFLDRLFQSES